MVSKTKRFEVPNTLEYMGAAFQYNAVKLLLQDTEYQTSLISRIKPDYFTAEGLSDVVESMVNRWKTTSMPSKIDDIFYELKNKCGEDETKQNKLHYTIEKLKEASYTNTDTIKVQFYNFLNVHFIFDLANDITAKATLESNFGKSDNILMNLRDKIELMLSSAAGTNINVSPMDYVESVFNEEESERITTGEPILDEIFAGGLPKGTVGGIIAPTGGGKSTLSTMLAYEAAMAGYNVVHFYSEDMPNDIAKKYFARMTGCEVRGMKKGNEEYHNMVTTNEAGEVLKQHSRVISFPNGQTTVEDLELILRTLKNVYGFSADVVFIDYYDCLKFSRSPMKDDLTADKQCMKKLENMAKRMDIGLWIAFQTNRTVMPTNNDSEFILGKCIQGSYHRLQTCSHTIGLRLENQLRDADSRAIEIEKNRSGSRCIIHNVKFNNGTLKFDLTNSETTYIDTGNGKTNDTNVWDEWERDFDIPVEAQEPFKTPVKDEPFKFYVK